MNKIIHNFRLSNIKIKLPFLSYEENRMYGGTFENKLSLKPECFSELTFFFGTSANFRI